MTESRYEQHLRPDQLAAYVEGTLTPAARDSVQVHLGRCAECRDELAEVAGIVSGLRSRARVRPRVWIPAAAAAALVLALVRPFDLSQFVGRPDSGHRQAAVLTTVAPRAILPIDTVRSAGTLVWSEVPTADRYRVRLFDDAGTVRWEIEVADTVASLPDSVRLHASRSYYWKVEAHTGFDRWAASDLVAFVIRPEGRR